MADACLTRPATKPIVTYLKLRQDGEPYLEGCRCNNCGETFIEPRGACSNCLARDRMESIQLANTGKVYNWTIVHRSFPGVKVPFISVVVDLDGGGTIKGNLIGVDPDPAQVTFDMPVEIVCRPLEQSDAEGNLYIGYFFVSTNTEGNNS
jgi:uncharacterized protein